MSLSTPAAAGRDIRRRPVASPPHDGFHAVELRTGKRPPDRVLNKIAEDADAVYWLPEVLHEHASAAARGDHPPDLEKRYRHFPWWHPLHRKLIVVAAHEEARALIGEQRWGLGNVEIARDRIVPSIWLPRACRISAFVTASNRGTARAASTPTARRRPTWTRSCARHQPQVLRRRHSDFTGEGPCDHLEATVVGKQARERLGLFSSADIPTFTPAQFNAFWRRYERYAAINFELLGRTNSNTRTGDDRRKPHIERAGGFTYNFDTREGGTCCDDGIAPGPPTPLGRLVKGLPTHCVQAFLDELAELHRKAPARWPPQTALGCSI